MSKKSEQFKGTKGKWRTWPFGDTREGFVHIAKEDFYSGYVGSTLSRSSESIDFYIEQFGIEAFKHDRQKTEANAQLMSKAPELLEKLEDILEIISDNTIQDLFGKTYDEAQKLIDEAIL